MKTAFVAIPIRPEIAHQGCAECERLWQELSSAAKAYVKIFTQYKGVAGQRRSTPHTRLKLRAAAEHRNWARKALKDHDETHVKLKLAAHG